MNPLLVLFQIALIIPLLNVLVSLNTLLGDFGTTLVIMSMLSRGIWLLCTFPFSRAFLSPKGKGWIPLRERQGNAKGGNEQEGRGEHRSVLRERVGIAVLLQILFLFGLSIAFNDLSMVQSVSELNRILYPFVPPVHRLPDLTLSWFEFLNPAWHSSLSLPDPSHTLPLVAGLLGVVEVRLQASIFERRPEEDTKQSRLGLLCVNAIMAMALAWVAPAGVMVVYLTGSLLSLGKQVTLLLRLRGIRGQSSSAADNTLNEADESPKGEE